MKDKFSLYQADGFWGIIEDASDEKQTSVKSYIGPDLIVKRLNEQADQIDQLKQQLAEKDIRIEELEGQFAYECECNMQLVDLQKQLEEKQKTIDEINKEFVQAVHDWKVLCAEKDKKLQEVMSNIVGLVRGGELILLDKVERFIDSEIEIPNDIGAIKLTQFFEEEIQRIKTGETYINWKQSQIQLAIQKLEEVKNKCNGMYELWLDSNYKENMYNNEDIAGVFEDISVFTNDLIKKLKGE